MNDKTYKEYELECDKARENNSKLLVEFERHLISNSLSSKTIKRHVSDIEFYANSYLLRYEVIHVEKGSLQI